MKTLFLTLVVNVLAGFSFGQTDSTSVVDTTIVSKVMKTDGTHIIGVILKQDQREILLRTTDKREIFIPQYMIQEITPLKKEDFNSQGDFVGEDKFATRYFITTNGLPIKKGEHYVQWNLFGPDFQFGLGNNFGVGVMTSWVGMPIIGTIKKSWELSDKAQFAVGGLVGTGTWIAPDWGGALPFATLSFGNRKSNIAFSGGYGAVWFGDGAQGRGLASVAGMVKVSSKISLVFDSFILLPSAEKTYTYTNYDYVYNSNTGMYEDVYTNVTEKRRDPALALLIPGIRWHVDQYRAFQFGFTAVAAQGDFFPIPIPMVQWYRTLK